MAHSSTLNHQNMFASKNPSPVNISPDRGPNMPRSSAGMVECCIFRRFAGIPVSEIVVSVVRKAKETKKILFFVICLSIYFPVAKKACF